MDVFAWFLVALIVLATLARRSGGVKRGIDAVQRQIAAAQAAAQEAAAAAAARAAAAGVSPLRPAVPPRPAAPRPVRPPPVPAPPPAATNPPAAPPAPAGALHRTLAEAFGDAAHARTAVILAEILGPPKALR